jgi:hypothetical protein
MAPWRAATREVLNSPEFSFLDPWIFEDAPATTQVLADSYLSEVQRSALFILLIGSTVTSPVMAELDAARDAQVPILAYVLKVKRRTKDAKELIAGLEVKYGPVDTASVDDVAAYKEALTVALQDETARRWDKRRVGAARRQLDLIGKDSLGRCVARWQGAGLSLAQAERLARDERVGAPDEVLARRLLQERFVVILGDLGSGKSLTAERIYQAAIRAASGNHRAPLPIYVEAGDLEPRLRHAVQRKCAELGRSGISDVVVVVDDVSRLPIPQARQLLQDARALVHSSQASSVVVTTRYLADVFTSELEEAYVAPPLSEEQTLHLIGESAGAPIPDLQAFPPSVQLAVRRPLYAILAGAYHRHHGDKRDYSPIALLSFLVERSLDDPLALGLQKALKRLALLTVDSGKTWLPTRDVGDDEGLRVLRRSALTQERDGEVSFALPILAEWFAAKSLGDGDPPLDELLSEPSRLDRWAYPLMLSTGVWDHDQAWNLLETLVSTHPEIAARSVSDGLPEAISVPASGPPQDTIAVGNELRRAMTAWAVALGLLSTKVVKVREDGSVMTVGVRRYGDRLEIGWYQPDDLPPAVDLPDSCGFMRLGPGWVELRAARPERGAIWAWQWTLESIQGRLDQVTLSRRLELTSGPYLVEAARASALALLRHQLGHLEPLLVTVLEKKTEGMGPNWFVRWLGKSYFMGPLLHVLTDLREHNEKYLKDPWPHPGIIADMHKPEWSQHTRKQIQERLEAVFMGALEIYASLVSKWLPTLSKRMTLECLSPVSAIVNVSPAANNSPISAPHVYYCFRPIENGQPSRVDVQFEEASRPFDFDAAQREYREESNAVRELRPEVAVWASPLSYNHHLLLFRSPATVLAFYWLRHDLHSMGWLPKRPSLTELTA